MYPAKALRRGWWPRIYRPVCGAGASDGLPLAAVIASVNELLGRLTRGRKYATLIVAEWNATSECLTMVNAGHLPLFLRRDGEVLEYGATGRPIGLIPEQIYEAVRIDLRPGRYSAALHRRPLRSRIRNGKRMSSASTASAPVWRSQRAPDRSSRASMPRFKHTLKAVKWAMT